MTCKARERTDLASALTVKAYGHFTHFGDFDIVYIKTGIAPAGKGKILCGRRKGKALFGPLIDRKPMGIYRNAGNISAVVIYICELVDAEQLKGRACAL